ncbi:MAG: hypothetical protein R2692_06680 [Microbacterium sp.]
MSESSEALPPVRSIGIWPVAFMNMRSRPAPEALAGEVVKLLAKKLIGRSIAGGRKIESLTER